MAMGNIFWLLECAVVLVELGSELSLLFLGLAFWRPLRFAVIAVVDWVCAVVEASAIS